MVSCTLSYAAAVLAWTSLVSAHASIFHPSMFGFNQTDASHGNRAQDPIMNRNFSGWWFHNHTHLPPHPEDVKQMPVGEASMFEISCDKDATSYWTSGPGGNQTVPGNESPCPHSTNGMAAYHTNGITDLGGCALGVAYKDNILDVQPEDIGIFSVNQTCVWSLHTYFEVPKNMPPCPNGKCICAWFWMHEADSGSEQMYMTGFQCNFTNTVSTVPMGRPKVPRRCGPEARNGFTWNNANCTHGPQQPFYWLQNERCNTFEDYYDPPLYKLPWPFLDGAQDYIFEGTYTDTTPDYSQLANGTPSSNETSSSNGTPSSNTPSASSALLVATPNPSSSPTQSLSPSPTAGSDPAMPAASDAYGTDCSDAPGASQSWGTWYSGTSSWPSTETADATAQTPSASGSALPTSGAALPSGSQPPLSSQALAASDPATPTASDAYGDDCSDHSYSGTSSLPSTETADATAQTPSASGSALPTSGAALPSGSQPPLSSQALAASDPATPTASDAYGDDCSDMPYSGTSSWSSTETADATAQTPTASGSALPTSGAALPSGSQPPLSSQALAASDPATPTATDAYGDDCSDDSYSGTSSWPSTETADATAQTPSGSGSVSYTSSWASSSWTTASSLPSGSAPILISNNSVSGSAPSGAPSTSAPAGASTADPTSTSECSEESGKSHTRRGWKRARQEKRNESRDEGASGVRRAWGAHRRRVVNSNHV